jgi:hypothetical protein
VGKIFALTDFFKNRQQQIVHPQTIFPASGLIDYFKGDKLVLINKSATARDTMADLVIREPIGEVFSQIHV